MPESVITTNNISGVSVRAKAFLCLTLLVYALLIGRLVKLQLFQHNQFAEIAHKHQETSRSFSPIRGSITDDQGRILAMSVPVHSLAVDPKVMLENGTSPQKTVNTICKALSLTPREIQRIYEACDRQQLHNEWIKSHPDSEENCPYRNIRFVWVKRQLDEKVYKTVRTKSREAKLQGIAFPEEHKRTYTQGSIAAHVLGMSDIDGHGLEGIEKLCEPLLKGKKQVLRAEKDARGKLLCNSDRGGFDSRIGNTVRLTIDVTIQMIAEEELKNAVEKHKGPNTKGCAIVMDPYTGDILAMANYPTFDPNSPGDSPVANRFNMCVASSFEPGSTFKPFIMAAALQEKKADLNEKWFCENGAWRMANGRILRDSHGYGWLTTAGVIIKSSNIGIAKVAARLGMDKTHSYVLRFGFGERTGLGLSGEIESPVRPVNKWTSYSMGSVPMGQEIAITPLQLANAYCAIANGGILMKPRLVKELIETDGTVTRKYPAVARQEVLEPQIAARMRIMLGRVVEEGTGRRARIEEYAIAGKTGTAQLAVNAEEIRAGHRGYSPDRYVGSFVGFSPVKVPRIVVLVSIWEPLGAHYGGIVAAPAMTNICRRTLLYMKVPPRTMPSN